MFTTPPQINQQVARQYTRDRIREAEAGRAGRVARAAARRGHADEVAPTPPAAVRRWWLFPAHATTA
jgi:hypothetical protein